MYKYIKISLTIDMLFDKNKECFKNVYIKYLNNKLLIIRSQIAILQRTDYDY